MDANRSLRVHISVLSLACAMLLVFMLRRKDRRLLYKAPSAVAAVFFLPHIGILSLIFINQQSR